VISLLIGLINQHAVKRVLIIAPVSVLPSWQRELEEHLKPVVKNSSISVINSEMTKGKRIDILNIVFSKKIVSIVVSSHQLVANMVDNFAEDQWDYVVLDEGHVIKNPKTKLYIAMNQLRARHRLLLTGTPIQNKLIEFWTLMNWATFGKTFGTLKEFNMRIAEPISKGQDPKALETQLEAASEATKLLMRLSKPVFLQRKKSEQPKDALQLPPKTEIVLWIALASEQRQVYDLYLQSSAYNNAFERSTYPVEVVTYFKSLCRHPLLIEAYNNKKKRAQNKGLNALTTSVRNMSLTSSYSQQENNTAIDEGNIFDLLDSMPNTNRILKGSIKLRVLLRLVSSLIKEKHRVLIFSQSKLMLQIIQYTLEGYQLSSYKIDGSTSLRDRQSIIDKFNNAKDSSVPAICLLTTKACGCGITLTGADRVIIFDPCKCNMILYLIFFILITI